MISFEQLLRKVGEHGWAQVLAVLLMSFSLVLAGFNSLAAVFVGVRPEFRCSVPPIDNFSMLTEDDILNLTTPVDPKTGVYQTCQRYGYDLNTCNVTLDCVNKSAPSIPCDQGYSYDGTVFKETIVTEFDLVCDRSYLNPLSSSMYYVGMLFGSLIFGDISDRIGRKPILLGTYVIAIACMFGVTYSVNIEMFIIFRTLTALFTYASNIAGFVYAVEMVGTQWRTVFGISYGLFFTYGYMLLGGLAAIYRDWHNLYFVCTVICIPFILPIAIMPESPRWLLAKGKDREGKKVVRLMARINRKKIEEIDFEEATIEEENKAHSEKEYRSYTILDLYRKPAIRLLTFKITFSWFVNSYVYYGISLNAGALDGDIFKNNTLNGALDVAAHILMYFQMQTKLFGRRLTESSMLFLACVSLVASIVGKEFGGENEAVQTFGVVMAFVAKFGISASFAAVYYITTEVYPTIIRANGLATGSLFARIGGIVAPYVIYLQDYVEWLPNLIFAVGAFLAGIVALYVPETYNVPMMETMEEAEMFYKTGKTLKQKKISRAKETSFSNKECETKLISGGPSSIKM